MVNTESKDKRLEIIVRMIDNGANIADVGSDHCFVPIECCKLNKIKYAQAIENKKGPYSRMVKAINDNGCGDRIKPSLSNGLNELDEKVDTVILAGMGGKLIVSILNENLGKLDAVQTIIVDAHNDREFVTKYLESISYRLIENYFLYEANIAYDIMKWKKGSASRKYSEDELRFGPLNLISKNDAWKKYWLSEKTRIEYILKSNKLPNEKKDEYIKSLDSINKNL